MFTATRIESTIKPEKFESLNNGIWYYNYDVKETTVTVSDMTSEEEKEETRYSYVQVRISGKPTYEKCVKAIIRSYIDTDAEFDLINSYNAYQLDISIPGEEYEEYLQLVKEVKEKVGDDFLIAPSVGTYSAPKQSDVMKLMAMTINTMELTDQQALKVKSLYPEWSEFVGETLGVGKKVKYDGKLFKVAQEHLVQEHLYPSINTASLYTEIVEDKSGTIDDPIPYPADGNMEIFKGKYYIENEIIYECIRNSGQPLYASLANLVGNYVQVVG